jgi:hypothetical protein
LGKHRNWLLVAVHPGGRNKDVAPYGGERDHVPQRWAPAGEGGRRIVSQARGWFGARDAKCRPGRENVETILVLPEHRGGFMPFTGDHGAANAQKADRERDDRGRGKNQVKCGDEDMGKG